MFSLLPKLVNSAFEMYCLHAVGSTSGWASGVVLPLAKIANKTCKHAMHAIGARSTLATEHALRNKTTPECRLFETKSFRFFSFSLFSSLYFLFTSIPFVHIYSSMLLSISLLLTVPLYPSLLHSVHSLPERLPRRCLTGRSFREHWRVIEISLWLHLPKSFGNVSLFRKRPTRLPAHGGIFTSVDVVVVVVADAAAVVVVIVAAAVVVAELTKALQRFRVTSS